MREEVAVKMTKKSGKVKEHRNLKCKSAALDFTWSNLQPKPGAICKHLAMLIDLDPISSFASLGPRACLQRRFVG